MGKFDIPGGEKDDRYIKLEEGATKLRVLDAEPAFKWTHWIGNRPYNCPGLFSGCPVCVAREAAKAKGMPEKEYKSKFRISATFLVNALQYKDDGTQDVKVLSFGPAIAEGFKGIETAVVDEGMDITSMDIKIVKTGKSGLDVKYTVVNLPAAKLSADQQLVVAEKRHDLSELIKPNTNEEIRAALTGASTPSTGAEAGSAGSTEGSAPAAPGAATEAELNALLEVIKSVEPSLGLSQFAVKPGTTSSAEVQKLITSLSGRS